MALGIRQMRVSGSAGSWLVWVVPNRGVLPRSVLVCDSVPAFASPWPARYRTYLFDGVGYQEATP